MALIDKEIYVARPDVLGVVGPHVLDWEEALAKEASTTSAITVLGGYYSRDALLALCLRVPNKPKRLRKECRVRIAVGLEGSSTLAAVCSELRAIAETLRQEGFGDVDLGVISRDPVHFHTKLFGFVQNDVPIWYVGSANPGSRRHELMVRIRGGHRAVTAYAYAAFRKSLKIQDAVPDIEIKSLREFFLAGVLCHKPPARRIFTFDAFRFGMDHRAKLNRLFAQGARVSHAQTRTEGFGFGLAGALGSDAAKADDDDPAAHIRFAESAVDTVLGLWMPNTYRDELLAKLRVSEALREKRLARIGELLASENGTRAAVSAFNDHVKSMTAFLSDNGIGAKPIPLHAQRFDDFLERRRVVLGDEAARRRHARLVMLTPMPDIWDDGRATRDFEESFFADVSYRAGPAAGNKGRVVRSILGGTKDAGYPDTADDIREALTARLQRSEWTVDDWLGRRAVG